MTWLRAIILILVMGGGVLWLASSPAYAQFDGGPGLRPHQGEARVNRLSIRGGRTSVYPMTVLARVANQSINNSAETDVQWDTVLQDDVGAFASAASTINVNCPQGFGHFRATGYGQWAANSTGARHFGIKKNGNPYIHEQLGASNETGEIFVTRWLSCVGGVDVFKVTVFQTSGGALNFSGSSYGSEDPYIQFEWAP